MVNEPKPHIDNLHVEKAKFVLESARIHMDGLLDTSDKVDSKSMILLGFLFSLTNALVGYLALNWSILPNIFRIPLVLYVHILLVSDFLLLLAVRPKNFEARGNTAQNLLKEPFYSNDFAEILRKEAERISRVSSNNQVVNQNKAKLLKAAIVTTFLGFVLITLATAISLLACTTHF